MKLNVDGQTLDFELDKLLNVEVIDITKKTGISFTDFGEQLQAMNFELITAIVYVLRKRTEPDLRLGDVTFAIGSLSIEADEEAPKEISEPETI